MHVLLHGASRDAKTLGDAGIRAPFGHEREDLALARGKHVERILGTPRSVDALSRTDVVSSLNDTLMRTHGRRDSMLDAVIALPAEGARGDYDDGMSDTLGMYPGEEKLISSALQNDALIDSAHTGLTNALARVQATDAKVNVVWGGGE